MEVKGRVLIKKEYKKIKNKETNEDVVLKIMNASTQIFTGKYEHNEDQSHSQCDFYNIATGEKYDVKLLFSEDVCKAINNEDIQTWFNEIRRQVNEIHDSLMKNSIKIEDTELYKCIMDRISKIEIDENCILFYPFPIGLESSKSVFAQLVQSTLGYIYSKVVENNPCLKIKKNCYLIYSNQFNEVVINDIHNSRVEFLQGDYLSKYLTQYIDSFKK